MTAPYRPHRPAPESETTLLVIAKQTRFAGRARELALVLGSDGPVRPGGGTAREQE